MDKSYHEGGWMPCARRHDSPTFPMTAVMGGCEEFTPANIK
ncbi:MAG TPA: hypothetical protein PKE35_16300 [Anaerolineales bacterium]|nr:hypothetical protein [Anaerolineales bacterium]HMX75817.1 hypothetical protein [Anaerolineales bacterium]HNA55861.1 hypothetical protein [Anaerolineales bacterium]HNB88217.1 hypothetical protein [Anaerolineales bacterium]HNC91132.1 hypothetical protein [Anaerolineales bacterium]